MSQSFTLSEQFQNEYSINIFQHKLFQAWLQKAQRILVVAIGGGGDAISALPLVYFFQESGKSVSILNIHYVSKLQHVISYACEFYGKCCFKLFEPPPKETRARFSELSVSAITGIPCWTGLCNFGAVGLANSLTKLVDDLGVDSVCGVDGGTDCLADYNTELTSILTDAISLSAMARLMKWMPIGVIGACADLEMGPSEFFNKIKNAIKYEAFCGTLLWQPGLLVKFAEILEHAKGRYPFSVSETVLRAARGEKGVWRNQYDQNIPIIPMQSTTFLFDINLIATVLNPFVALVKETTSVEEARKCVLHGITSNRTQSRPYSGSLID